MVRCCLEPGKKKAEEERADRTVRETTLHRGWRRVAKKLQRYTDQEETKEEQENRIEHSKKKGDLEFIVEGRTAEITGDLVLQARAKMSENNVNGPEDAMVSEMIKQLPLKKTYTIWKCFQERFMDQMESPSSWKIVKLVFFRKPDAEPKKGFRSYRAIALTSVMSKWYASCILLRLEKGKEPEKWNNLRIGGMDGISCQHLQVTTTKLLPKHGEWQEERNPC